VLASVWIEKWRQLPKHSMQAPCDCLFDRDDISDRLSEITCPAIIIHGTADQSIEVQRARELARGLTGCDDVVLIEGAPHASNLTHPDEVNPPLRAFLDSLAPAAADSL
jgi:3-oxoadipate enol-lactonase